MAQRESKSEPPAQQRFKCRKILLETYSITSLSIHFMSCFFFCAFLKSIQQRLSTKQGLVIESSKLLLVAPGEWIWVQLLECSQTSGCDLVS